MIVSGKIRRAGLVATNSVRGGASRVVLDKIISDVAIVDAWADEEWTVDGAAVRVSLICIGEKGQMTWLNGNRVSEINADLTGGTMDLTKAKRLSQNKSPSFQGPVLVGNFDIPGELARDWLQAPLNPNGLSNAQVLRPLRNGKDLTTRPRDRWVVDFNNMNEFEAALFEKPFQYIERCVKPFRIQNRRSVRALYWWRHGETGVSMWQAIAPLKRYIVCSQVSKHRVFAWLDLRIQPHQTVIAIARDDDTTFGIVHSRFHEAWSLRLGTSLEDRPRYTPSTTFETFPFPEGLTPDRPAAFYALDPRAVGIAAAAWHLDDLRRKWLNPTDLVRLVPEVMPGFPDRMLPINESAALALKTRTLTNLYNERPAWLDNAHRNLDAAVALAYGWPADISDEDALGRLLEINLARAAVQETRPRRVPRPNPQGTLLLPIAGGEQPTPEGIIPEPLPTQHPRRRKRSG